jgi:hypothetical protein
VTNPNTIELCQTRHIWGFYVYPADIHSLHDWNLFRVDDHRIHRLREGKQVNQQNKLDLMSVCFIVGFVAWVVLLTTFISKPRTIYDFANPPLREWKEK